MSSEPSFRGGERPFRLGYNTNGFTSHRLDEALRLIAELGYGAVALTPDVGCLDPYRLSTAEVRSARELMLDLGLSVAVETGARYVLDPRRKHRPNLLEADRGGRQRRVDFYRRSIDLASELGASVVSIWSGAAPEGIEGTLDADAHHPLGERLAEGVALTLAHAGALGVRLCLEPEPGMFVERPAGFLALLDVLGSLGDDLGLTLDLGHCVVTDDLPVSDVIARFRDRLAHVHVADCPRHRHLHVPLGEGDLDLDDAMGGLVASGFSGIAAVELSRDGHRAPEAARDALRSIHSSLLRAAEANTGT